MVRRQFDGDGPAHGLADEDHFAGQNALFLDQPAEGGVAGGIATGLARPAARFAIAGVVVEQDGPIEGLAPAIGPAAMARQVAAIAVRDEDGPAPGLTARGSGEPGADAIAVGGVEGHLANAEIIRRL